MRPPIGPSLVARRRSTRRLGGNPNPGVECPVDCEFETPFLPPVRPGDVVAIRDEFWLGRLVWFDRVGPRAVLARAATPGTPRGAQVYRVAGWPRPGAVALHYVRLATAPTGTGRLWWRPW